MKTRFLAYSPLYYMALFQTVVEVKNRKSHTNKYTAAVSPDLRRVTCLAVGRIYL